MPKRYLYLFLLLLSGFPLFANSASDTQLLLDYQREFGMIQETDNSVSVRLFADGTVEVHYPVFMRRAGDYQYQLSAAETNNIVTSLRQLGVDRFDAETTKSALALEQRAALEAAQLPGQGVRIITDPEITHIHVSNRLSPAADLDGRRFSFVGIRNQAQLYPQITALEDLSQALDVLDALTTDLRMQRIEVAQ